MEVVEFAPTTAVRILNIVGVAFILTLIYNGTVSVLLTILLRGIPLPLAVVGHEGSTVLVSLNGLRLLSYRE